MSNISKDELKKLFNERKRLTMEPTPYVLFFLHRGKEFALRESAKLGNRRPKPSDFIITLQQEWAKLTEDEKGFYLLVAMEMGYEKTETFIERNKLREKMKKRIKNDFFLNFF